MLNSFIVIIVLLLTFIFKTPVYAAVTITITSSPSSTAVMEEFNVSFNASGLDTNAQYYKKLRLGVDSGTATKGQTKNGDLWLDDNDAWTTFPTVTSDISGNLDATLIGRTKSTVFLGENQLFVRLRKVGTTDNITSTSVKITITQSSTPTSTPTPIPATPTSAPVNTPTPIKTPTKTPATPTKAATGGSSATSSSTPTPTKANTPTSAKTAKAQSEAVPTASLSAEILGEKTSSQQGAAQASTEGEVVTAGFFQRNLAKLFIIVGGAMLIVTAVVLTKMKIEL